MKITATASGPAGDCLCGITKRVATSVATEADRGEFLQGGGASKEMVQSTDFNILNMLLMLQLPPAGLQVMLHRLDRYSSPYTFTRLAAIPALCKAQDLGQAAALQVLDDTANETSEGNFFCLLANLHQSIFVPSTYLDPMHRLLFCFSPFPPSPSTYSLFNAFDNQIP